MSPDNLANIAINAVLVLQDIEVKQKKKCGKGQVPTSGLNVS